MRFIHTADWQIGMKAARIGDKAEQVRAARLETAREIATLLLSEAVDFVLLAADTFEHHGVSRVQVREVVRTLNKMKCPVYVIPGNHDYLTTPSIWDGPVWEETENVHILRDETPIPPPGGAPLPCPRSPPLRIRWHSTIDSTGACGTRCGCWSMGSR